MSTITAARVIAYTAHAGQLDKAGRPYIEHPEAVANMCAKAGYSPEVIMAAWLHDVVEDTDVTLDDLRAEGFPEAVISAVDSVTRRPGEIYRNMIKRAAADPIGVLVKLADNKHNTDRLDNLEEPIRSGMARRYEAARLVLLAVFNERYGGTWIETRR